MCVWYRVCRDDERAGGSPRLRFRTLVRTPARGVSSALPAIFTRGLPPGGSTRRHRVCQDYERTGGSPRWRFRTLVRIPARGVSSALPAFFTRGLPPGGSTRLPARCRTLYPRAPARRLNAFANALQGSLPAGCRPAAQRVCQRVAGLFTRGLPPGGLARLLRRFSRGGGGQRQGQPKAVTGGAAGLPESRVGRGK
ncbi:MAG: hypothetical protein RLZZ436_57 [Planctomycetota bacterium]